MGQVINQIALYLLLALGGVGVCMALPRRGVSPQLLGAVIAAAAGGLVVLLMSLAARPHVPNLYFYIFSAIALGGALRVITHPRPVYAALYFVLTILSSAGLYVILSAEFVAFALVIVYAGAILITYLFVIMLATQAPSQEESELVADYDTVSREPLAAAVVGFVLLGVLTTMLFTGAPTLRAAPSAAPDSLLAELPRKLDRELRRAGALRPGMAVATDSSSGRALIDVPNGLVYVVDDRGRRDTVALPASVHAANVESVGYDLLARHPGSIEIAGVILLMAMLGAVVLARRQVQMDEEAKAAQAAKLRLLTPAEPSGPEATA